MKKILTLIFAIFFTLSVFGQEWKRLELEGNEFYEAGNYEKAAFKLYSALYQMKADLGIKNPTYIAKVKHLIEITKKIKFSGFGTVEKWLYYQIFTLAKEVLGEDHTDYIDLIITVIQNTSWVNSFIEELCLNAIPVVKNKFGENHLTYITIHKHLGIAYIGLGKEKKADETLKYVSNLMENKVGENELVYILFLEEIGKAYERTNNKTSVEYYLQKEVQIRKKVQGEYNPEYLEKLIKLGTIYSNHAGQLEDSTLRQAKYSEAVLTLKQALPIAKNIYENNHREYAKVIYELAMTYSLQRNYNDAEILYEQGFYITKVSPEVNPNEDDLYFKFFSNLLYIYSINKKYKEADDILETVLSQTKSVLGISHKKYIDISNRVSIIYKEKKQYDKAEAILRQVVQVDTTFYTLENLAELYQLQGRYVEAQPVIEKAIEKLPKKGQISESLFYKLAINHYALGNPKKAETYLEQVLNSEYKNKVRWFLGAEEGANSIYERFFQEKVKIFYSLETDCVLQNSYNLDKFYTQVLRYKAVLFNNSRRLQSSIQQRINLGQSRDSTFLKHYQDLKQQKSNRIHSEQENSYKQQRLTESLESRLITQNINEIEKTIDTSLYSWRDIKLSLKEGEAAIEIVRVQKWFKKWTDTIQYAAFIVTSRTNEKPKVIIFDNGNVLEDRYIRLYRQSIYKKLLSEPRGTTLIRNDSITSAHLDSLYYVFWQPISKVLSGIKKIYLSPDGVFHRISLPSLRNPQTGKFLVEDLDIQLISSTKELLQKESPNSYNSNAILIGYPTYQLNDAQKENAISKLKLNSKQTIFNVHRAKSMGGSLPPLPETKTEVVQIQKLLNSNGWSTQTYLGEEALEEMIKIVQSPSILHIATHGFFEKDTSSTDNLKSEFIQENVVNKAPPEPPLLRSGLFLAGAETNLQQSAFGSLVSNTTATRYEDGILTAYEVSHLNLEQTELVVLSACETGLGAIKNGEGVYGLQRAFRIAGAKSLLFSLWQVDDEATQLLMTSFYDHWLKNKNKQKALKAAQLALKSQSKYKDPYYWGAFVLIGQ